MKKLFSMIAISTLGVTVASASSLKPLFTSNVSHDFKSKSTNKEISVQGENNTNPFINKINNISEIFSVAVAPDGAVYVGTNHGTWVVNLINLLLNINNNGFFNNKIYSGVVYNKEQKIGIKDNFIESTILDSKNITIPVTDLDLTNGEHTLILTLKDEYKQNADLFGGKDGQVTYKLWVKTSIDNDKINYQTNKDDTDLLTGLTSDSGNTNGCDIIQTRSKVGNVHPATLSSKFDDVLIDYPNSYYVQGTVDDTNNFTESGNKQNLSQSIGITVNGIYHLHLVDTVGITYDSYLELGQSNWKLNGQFDDKYLNQLAEYLM
ncbi:hypothetical protein [Spiroplasma endosymbiont of Nebria brevicollis]|uniref:hypothetical protein n=1 Tax=Spiroplasma endosymbiont of Nebria brevicollis TaxID=3066284 RepID=UPI00313C3961